VASCIKNQLFTGILYGLRYDFVGTFVGTFLSTAGNASKLVHACLIARVEGRI
jgi:hypothetical protein